MGKFVLKETATGFKFDLKAGNGEVIATSEVYSTKAACENGIESVKKNCVGEIEDQTAETVAEVSTPSLSFMLTRQASSVSVSRLRTARSLLPLRAIRPRQAVSTELRALRRMLPRLRPLSLSNLV